MNIDLFSPKTRIFTIATFGLICLAVSSLMAVLNDANRSHKLLSQQLMASQQAFPTQPLTLTLLPLSVRSISLLKQRAFAITEHKGNHSEELPNSPFSIELSSVAESEISDELSLSASQLDSDASGMPTNQKPIINVDEQQRLQQIIADWDFHSGTSVNYRLKINNLFTDNEQDLLTTRVTFSVPGLSISNNALLAITGSPQLSDQPSVLIISAKDAHHGDEAEAWVNAELTLPTTIDPEDKQSQHPFIDATLYRLASSPYFLGEIYEYEIVYCEAFRFINNRVFYAAATNKRQCPTDQQLRQVGSYQLEVLQAEQSTHPRLIVNSDSSQLDAEQIWEIKHSYQSKRNKGESHLTSVYSNKHVETYTVLKNKAAMETRLNMYTGLKVYQMETFEYFFPINGSQQYLAATAGIYIGDSRMHNPDWLGMDSDLNINSDSQDITCQFVTKFYQSSILAGQGVFGDIISTSLAPNWVDPLECEERINPSINKRYAYLDLDYSYYDEFIDGGVYSYVLTPKPEYAHLLEKLKLNLIYRQPDLD